MSHLWICGDCFELGPISERDKRELLLQPISEADFHICRQIVSEKHGAQTTASSDQKWKIDSEIFFKISELRTLREMKTRRNSKWLLRAG